MWPAYFSFYVNGALVVSERDEKFDPLQWFGLGIISNSDEVNKFRFKNCRIKPINYSAPPPPETKDPDTLIAYFTQVIESDSEDGHAYHQRGEALFQKKKYAEAKSDLQAAVKYGVGANVSIAIDRLGDIYDREGDHKRAAAQFREALRTCRPEQRHIFLTNLGFFLATCPDDDVRDGPEALKLALEANNFWKGEGPYISASLAAAYAETGNFAEAVAWGEKAAKTSSADDKKQSEARLELYRQKKPYRHQHE